MTDWIEIPQRAKYLCGSEMKVFLMALPKDSWQWDKCFFNGENAIEFADTADALAFKLKFGEWLDT